MADCISGDLEFEAELSKAAADSVELGKFNARQVRALQHRMDRLVSARDEKCDREAHERSKLAERVSALEGEPRATSGPAINKGGIVGGVIVGAVVGAIEALRRWGPQ